MAHLMRKSIKELLSVAFGRLEERVCKITIATKLSVYDACVLTAFLTVLRPKLPSENSKHQMYLLHICCFQREH